MKRRLLVLAGIAGISILVSSCKETGSSTAATATESADAKSQISKENETDVMETPVSAAGGDTEDQMTAAENTDEESGSASGVITTNGGTVIELSSLEHATDDDAPEVYYISDISPEALVEAYEALDWTPEGKTAVKLSTGEPPASNYLQPDLISSLVSRVDGTIVECMTAYGGQRSSAASAKQVAEDHGYTAIADFDLLDEDGEVEIPVEGGVRLTRDIVGSHIENYDNVLVLSHFKGHAMAGFGGAIKNVAIGMASRNGKTLIHSGGTSTSGSIFGGDQDAFLEALPEAVSAVSEYFNDGQNIVYVSVMNRLSVDCDCDGNPAEPDMHDIGILASKDPVALDQACVDLVYAVPDGESLIRRMESRNGIHALEHAEEIGLGSRTYHMVDLDE